MTHGSARLNGLTQLQISQSCDVHLLGQMGTEEVQESTFPACELPGVILSCLTSGLC